MAKKIVKPTAREQAKIDVRLREKYPDMRNETGGWAKTLKTKVKKELKTQRTNAIEDQLRKSYITSPIKGSVLVKYAETGELAAQGKALFKVADMENMFLRAYITADQLAQLKIGASVNVVAEFGAEKTREYKGQVVWISSRSEFTPKTIQTKDERANLVYAVKVLVKNDGYLKIGMYGGFKVV